VTSRAALLLALAGLTAASAALAHDARPLSIAIVEQADDVYRAIVLTPPTVETGNTPTIVWPENCRLIDGTTASAYNSTLLMRCSGGLASRTIGIDYPYYNPSLTTLIRLRPLSGEALSAVLPPDVDDWTIPAVPTLLSVARDYLALGFRHIWGGLDHLAFVAGLLLLARRPRRIVWAITGFTVAHSMTLSLAALGLVRPAVAPVETMIALSILFLAWEIARGDADSFSHRFPVVLSFVFGLLHGFGFAGALSEIGLPRGEIAAGLLFFNLGVEAGQLAFIAAVTALVAAGKQIPLRIPTVRSSGSLTTNLIGAYALGIPAAFWFVERLTVTFVP